MYEFHPVHDRDIWLSKGNTVADWCGGVSAQNTVLSRYPIQPGDTFTVRVTQANTGSWVSVLTIIDYLFVFVGAVFVALRSEEPDLIS